jgi:hypothetical protein
MLTIAVDYGLDSMGDLPVFVVAEMKYGRINVFESGLIDDFLYDKYLTTPHEIVGYDGDVERFRSQFGG